MIVVANGSGTWTKLTRGDLAQFDDVATNVVLYAMERGGVGRLSRRGHVILRAPAGGTMSVPKDGNRSQQVLELTVRKLFPELSGESSTTERVSADEHIRRIQQNIVPNPTLECTVPGCEAVFVTEGARYTHLNEKHYVCKHPGCFKAGDHKAGIDAHYRIVHQGWRPARGPHKSRKAGKTKTPRETTGDRVLAFFKSRPGDILTVPEIRAAVEGVDSTTLANYMSRNLGGDWGHVHRVDRGRYVFTPDGETPRETPATEDTTQQEEAPRTEPGDVVGAWKGDLLVEVHAFITKERDDLLERISRLEQENDQLRRSLDGVRKALRDE